MTIVLHKIAFALEDIDLYACLIFCKEADQQTERDEQEDLEGSRNGLAESAGKPVACGGDLSQLKIWVNTS